MAAFSVVGSSLPRIEGEEKVTGITQYAADVALPGLLWGKILRSSEPHARLRRVDTTRARQLPGVHAVVTGADAGPMLTGIAVQDMPVLCSDRVRFVGDPIAAVAAEDAETAEEALGLIEVEYEPLPAVFDPTQALADDAPDIHPDRSSYAGRPDLPATTNLQGASRFGRGDVAQGFAEADLVLEHTFTSSLAHQGYLEPRACVARVLEDGTLSVWSSCKVPYRLRDLLAELFALPKEQVVVERCSIGGDFGGKGAVGPEPIAALLARASGRPVKIVHTPMEEMTAENPRHAAVMSVKTGVKRDGTLVARQMKVVMDGGAYGAHKITPNIDLPSVARALGPYRIPHTLIEGVWAYTNNVPCGIARAPGQPQVVFAGESHLDLVAQALGMDPLELRLKNALEDGESWPDGAKFQGVMVRPTLELARRASDWDTPLGPNRGRGMAITERGIAAGACGLVVTLHDDGRITALSGIPDVGTGAFTILRQVLAEELHVPIEAVHVETGNTSQALPDAGIGGSKHTFSLTFSVVETTRELNARLLEVAAERLECAQEDVEISGQGYQVRGHPSSWIPTTEIAMEAAARAGGQLAARSTGPGRADRAPNSCSVVSVAEVEVDPETGHVTPVRLVMVHDVGVAINPALLQAQIEGATIQGLGMGLMEEMRREDGRIATSHLGDYKMPCQADVPPLVSVLVEGAPGPGPYQAKAVAELSICPVPAAVANAVAQAAGARVFDLPVSAERVRAAVRERTEVGSGTAR